MKIGKEARNGLISTGVAGATAAGGLLLTPWLLIPCAVGFICVGYYGDQWRIHRQAKK